MGESACYVELSDCRSVVEVQQTIRRHAENNPDLPWVIGTGWDQNLWSPPSCLTRRDLDAALPSDDDRPCLLYRRCWHAVAVNSAAMRAAGIDPDKKWTSPVPPPQPPPAGEDEEEERKTKELEGERVDEVDLDEEQRPTGLFRENSIRFVESAVSKPSFETRCDQFAEALGRCVRSGLTAVHSNDDDAVDVYARLQEEGRLPLRVFLTMPHEELENITTLEQDKNSDVTLDDGELSERNEPRDTDDDDTVMALKGAGSGVVVRKGPGSGVDGGGGGEEKRQEKSRFGGLGDDLVSRHRVKLFADGSLGAETAAMRVPYLGTDNKGILNHEPASLTRKVAQARDQGFRVEVHAIGDRALSAVLDAFEEAGITAADRPIVTHCQVAGPDLVKRMRALGAVAAVQPSFVPSDAAVVTKRLSPSVHSSCYPWRTLLHAGVTCAGSSDAPIETHDPMRGMYDAIYRPNKPPPPPPPPSRPQPSSPLAPKTGSEATAAAVHATAIHAVAIAATAATAAATASEVKDKAIENDSEGHEAGRGWGDGEVEEGVEHERGVTPFLPDERLTLEEAVWMYTTGGAVAAGVEDRLGVVRPRSLADLTIIEVEGGGEGLLNNPSLIVEAKVSQVWVGGSCRWNAAAAAAAADSPQAGMDIEGKRVLEGSLSGSGFPGKNGPKRKRASNRGGGGNNPWLSGGSGPRRTGRCRCCT
ncbi:unnamed protein product [Laminaria digitata]